MNCRYFPPQVIFRQGVGSGLQPEVDQGDALLDRGPASPGSPACRRDPSLDPDGAHQTTDGPPSDDGTLNKSRNRNKTLFRSHYFLLLRHGQFNEMISLSLLKDIEELKF